MATQVIIKNIEVIDKLRAEIVKMPQLLEKPVKDTSDVFFDAVWQNVSLTPHGSNPAEHLFNLAMMDYPFAERHGTIQEHGHEPIWGVHVMTGELQDELSSKLEHAANRIIASIGWMGTFSQYIRDVYFGTLVMLPRPVLEWTDNQIQTINIFEENVRTALGEVKLNG